MYICVYFQIHKYSQSVCTMFLLCMFPGLAVWCLFPGKTVSPTLHSQSRVEASLCRVSILVQCLDFAPRSLNCFLSSLRLSKVTIRSPVSLVTADKTGIQRPPCRSLSGRRPLQLPPVRFTGGHSFSQLQVSQHSGYARLCAGEIGAYDLFTLVFVIRTKTGFEQKIVYNPVF